MKIVAAILAILVFASWAVAEMAAPPLVNYQGKLTGSDGISLTDREKLQFRIWDSAGPGGNVVWGPQTLDPVPVVNGQFNVILSKAGSNGDVRQTMKRMIDNREWLRSV